MDIDIRMLSERLAKFKPKLIINNKNLTLVGAIKLYDENQVVFSPEYLYAGVYSRFPQSIPEDAFVNFLCIEDSPIPESAIENKNVNILSLKTSESLEKTFNTVQDIILANQSINRSAELLLDSLVHGKGIQHILEIGYQLLGNPIVIFDTEKKNLIAHTANIITDDPINNELLTYGYLSQDTLDFLESASDYQLVAYRRFPLIYQNQKLKHERIMGKIVVDNRYVACLVVWDNDKPLQKQDINLVEQLCEIISAEMQRNMMYRNMRGVFSQKFLSDILDGEIRESEVINKRAGNMQWKLQRYFRVVVIDTRHKYLNIPGFRDDIERMIACGKTFVYDNLVVSFINTDDKHFELKTKLKDLLDYLEKNNLNAGLSSVFYELANLSIQYRKALKAIDLGIRLKSSKVLFCYEDFQIYDFMDIRSNEVDLLDFCHPKALEMVNHDIKNNSSYAKTIYTYLECGKDSLYTADALYTHRNTILYRLERIKELFNIDMSDGTLLINIFVSLKILIFLDIHKDNITVPF